MSPAMPNEAVVAWLAQQEAARKADSRRSPYFFPQWAATPLIG
jgi:hypothetical protein